MKEMTAAAILQRLTVERDTLAEREAAAIRALETLGARIEQLEADLERESQLGGDAAREIERLFAEEEDLVAARDGHDSAQADADEAARAAATALGGVYGKPIHYRHPECVAARRVSGRTVELRFDHVVEREGFLTGRKRNQ